VKRITPLAALRRSRGLTLAQVATSMGSGQPLVSTFEQGKAEVAEDYMRRYARAVHSALREVRTAYWLSVSEHARFRLAQAQDALKRRPRRPLT
jgi:transcriptional regulator with XRE-family HTH domain